MKKFILPLLSILICGCSFDTVNNGENGEEVPSWADYAAFLGRSENNVKDFDKYRFVSFEFDEFSKDTISNLNKEGIKCFAYLNVGSLETYRFYYDDFSNLTFLDYENWDDERWIDITNNNWQQYLVNVLATSFKEKGATGVYLDNVDVYTVFKEEKMDYVGAGAALCNIITELNNLGLKVMMNSGSEFIDDMNDQDNDIFNSIWAYHQEEVFSLIKDYDNNVFGKQNKEDKSYYQEMARIMKDKGAQVFFLEYTKDEKLKKEIDSYCSKNQYHYYCASSIDLI